MPLNAAARAIVPAVCLLTAHTASAQTWDWQLSEPFDLSREVEILDLDPQNHSAEEIAALKARGVYLICYISVGTWEKPRPDAQAFPEDVLGDPLPDWPNERYLDIRRHDVLLPIMTARMEACADAGFDAVEPDNMDVYLNDSGFDLGPEDTLEYIRILAARAGALGLDMGQKNAPDLVQALQPLLDFIIVESCFDGGWCGALAPYRDAGKPILAAEYTRPRPAWCNRAAENGVSLIFKDTDLTRRTRRCKETQ